MQSPINNQPQAYPQYQGNQPMAGPLPTGEVFVAPPLRSDPVQMLCPSCKSMIASKITYESYMKTHLVAGSLCLCGLFTFVTWFCCCIPYCKLTFSFGSLVLFILLLIFRRWIMQKGKPCLPSVRCIPWVL